MFISKYDKQFLFNSIKTLTEFNVILEKKVKSLELSINALELNLKRPVAIKPKKRGRPSGSKVVRPKSPPKTPFELKKPLGRPKGSKNKPK